MRLCIVTLLCAVSAAAQSLPAWQSQVLERLPAYGHRNWIVIADSAYPAQSRDGIETIVANEGQVETLQRVLVLIGRSKHIRPIVYTDRELQFVDDKDAPGVESYRRILAGMFQNAELASLPHEEIIRKLDQAAQTFRVLIIKTRMTIPYTSVFLQLDCAYWSAEAEKKLRAAMSAAQ